MLKKIILFVLLLSIAGCAMPIEEQTKETAPTTESAATGIQEDISDIGNIDSDLDIDNLGDIDKEIDEIDW